jgi:hypothetical protein
MQGGSQSLPPGGVHNMWQIIQQQQLLLCWVRWSCCWLP